jgi:hypothetical protein
MKSLCEIFEYLSFCDSETIVKEIRSYCKRIIENHGNKSEVVLKLDVERLNTFLRLTEFMQTSELPRIIKSQQGQINPDEILTVEEVAKILKVTPSTVYTLVKKGKMKKMEISTVDKPDVKPKIRIRRKDVEGYLEG